MVLNQLDPWAIEAFVVGTWKAGHAVVELLLPEDTVIEPPVVYLLEMNFRMTFRHYFLLILHFFCLLIFTLQLHYRWSVL